jgi:hypothetical protein
MFDRRATLVGALILAVAHSIEGAPRIAFTRTIPARYDLGRAEHVAVIYAIGDSDKIDTFIAVLVDQTNDAGTLRATDATTRGPGFVGDQADPRTISELRRDHPADVYLGVKVFTCSTKPGEAELGTRNQDGTRVRRRRVWIDAMCSARIDVMGGSDLRRRFSYSVRGEGTSPRVDEITDEEIEIALEQAARYAAVEASESITPRHLRESIELDARAPAFEEGMVMIEVDRHEAARTRWQTELKRQPSSAALHHNLAAVAEAMGDREASARHWAEARRLAPDEDLYKREGRRFQRRPARKK